MALTNPRILYTTSSHFPHRRPITTISSPPPRGPHSSPRSSRRLVVSLAKKLSSSSRPTGKFDSKNRRGGPTSTKDDNDSNDDDGKLTAEIESANGNGESFEGYVLPDLPGLEKDFFEGPEWDAFGFFVQYLWAFGIVFALISSGIAVATYNEGATDFKETPAYKESIQAQELLEEPEASNSDVFESNPTEEAPSLE